MIVVKVELHSAVTHKITELARMHICNIGGTQEKGDYSVQTLRGRSTEDLDKLVPQRDGTVLSHSRLNDHVWYLVGKALGAVNYGAKSRPQKMLPGSGGPVHKGTDPDDGSD